MLMVADKREAQAVPFLNQWYQVRHNHFVSLPTKLAVVISDPGSVV